MFTAVVCNTLVSRSGRSCSGLFVDLRDHYCLTHQPRYPFDQQASGSERFLAVKSVGSCEAPGDSTTYPRPNPVCEFRTKIENIGRLRGPIRRLRRCADK